MREASLSWTESYPAMEYRHGPMSITDESSVVWFLGDPPHGLVDEVDRTGALVVSEPRRDPLAELIRIQRLAVEIGTGKQLDPDRPRNLSRSVILSYAGGAARGDGRRTSTAACVALDVGGTSMKGALVDQDAQVVRPTGVRHPRGSGSRRGRWTRSARRLQTLAGRAVRGRPGRAPMAAGLAVPGIVDEARGVAVRAANIGWHDVALVQILERRLGLPVALGHDVRAGGLAENVLGAAAGSRDMLFVALGTGIAASCIVDGRLLVAGGYAGEIGHVVGRRRTASPAAAAAGAASNVSPRRPRSPAATRPGAGSRSPAPPRSPRSSVAATRSPRRSGTRRSTHSSACSAPASPCSGRRSW